MKTIYENNLKKDYLKGKILMFFFLLLSANPFVKENIEIATVFLLILIFLLYPRVLKFDLNKEAFSFIIIIFFVSFELIHRFLFNLDNAKTIIRILGYYTLSYFMIKALKIKFIEIFIKLMYFFAVVSLFFVTLSYLNILNSLYISAWDLFPVTTVYNPTIIIYTFDHAFYSGSSEILRNAGFTWEAGGLASYINIALILHILSMHYNTKDIIRDKISITFIITTISTLSTTGITSLFLILFFTTLTKPGFFKYIFGIILIFLMYLSYNKFEFLGPKIEEQLELAKESQNRFGAALLDLKDFSQRPITGWSRKEEVLFGNEAFTYASHRPNGITNILRSYGIIYFIVLLLVWQKSFIYYLDFYGVKRKYFYSLLLIITILTLAFSQLIMNQLLFLSFLFLFQYYRKKAINE